MGLRWIFLVILATCTQGFAASCGDGLVSESYLVEPSGSHPAFVVTRTTTLLATPELVMERWHAEAVKNSSMKLPRMKRSDYEKVALSAVDFANAQYERREAWTEDFKKKLRSAAKDYLHMSTYFIVRQQSSSAIVGTLRLIHSPFYLDAATGLPLIDRPYTPLMMERADFLGIELPKFYYPDPRRTEKVFEGWNIEIGTFAVDNSLPWRTRVDIHSALWGEWYKDAVIRKGATQFNQRKHYFTYADDVSERLYLPLHFHFLWSYKQKGLWIYPGNGEKPRALNGVWRPLYLGWPGMAAYQDKREREVLEKGKSARPFHERRIVDAAEREVGTDYARFVRETFDDFKPERMAEARKGIEAFAVELDSLSLHFGSVMSASRTIEETEESFAQLLSVLRYLRMYRLKVDDFAHKRHPMNPQEKEFYYFTQMRILGLTISEWSADGDPMAYQYKRFLNAPDTIVALVPHLLNKRKPQFVLGLRLLRSLYQEDFAVELAQTFLYADPSPTERILLNLSLPKREPHFKDALEFQRHHIEMLGYKGEEAFDRVLDVFRKAMRPRASLAEIEDFQEICRKAGRENLMELISALIGYEKLLQESKQ
jgi:hypothetical protein